MTRRHSIEREVEVDGHRYRGTALVWTEKDRYIVRVVGPLGYKRRARSKANWIDDRWETFPPTGTVRGRRFREAANLLREELSDDAFRLLDGSA